MASVIFSPAYRTYSFGNDHPFSPVRIEMLLELLEALGHRVETIAPQPASRAEILDVHSDDYVQRVERMSAGTTVPDAAVYGLGTQDTPAFPGMDEAARWHVGGTLHGARLISAGKETRVLQLGGGLHHAGRSLASGFCIYNDLAIAIRGLSRSGLRTAYVDIDVHHANGVQEILYDDPGVLTVSLHESGQYLFPGSGEVRELGAGPGRGLKLNVPLQPFTWGASYLEVFEQVLPPALRHFRPDVLVVQAGADAHFDDPLADLMLTTGDYEILFRRILEWADQLASGRVLFTLGGGYSFRSAPRVWAMLYLLVHDLPLASEVPDGWRRKWEGILGEELPRTFHDGDSRRPEIPDRLEIADRNRQVAERLLDLARQYWH
ncbi:MAG: acetoin utilization protein AcuC [Acidithiobacillales bacterium]